MEIKLKKGISEQEIYKWLYVCYTYFYALKGLESQPEEYSLGVGISRSNAVHCGRCVKYNTPEICLFG